MERFAVFLTAVTPGVLVLAYGVTKTRSRWSGEALWTAFLLGGLGVVAAVPIELAIHWLIGLASLGPLMSAGALAVLVAAIPEETIKFLILIGAAENHVDARRRQDIIVLAIAVSLGFATVENFLYLVAPAHWGIIGTARALTAVPGHGIDGLAMGALLTAARVRPKWQLMWMALAVAIPVVMHAAYDFPLFVLRSHAAKTETALWIEALWGTILLVISTVGIGLCNWILPAAEEADFLSGRDSRRITTAMPLIVIGATLFLSALALILIAYLSRKSSGLIIGILPSVLALDLIRTGIRRRIDNEHSRASMRAMKRIVIR